MKTYYIGDLCILSKQTYYRIFEYDVRKIIENKYENGEITKNEHDEFKSQLSAFPYECLNDHKLEQFNIKTLTPASARFFNIIFNIISHKLIITIINLILQEFKIYEII